MTKPLLFIALLLAVVSADILPAPDSYVSGNVTGTVFGEIPECVAFANAFRDSGIVRGQVELWNRKTVLFSGSTTVTGVQQDSLSVRYSEGKIPPAILILMLISQGHISWNEKISVKVPEFRDNFKEDITYAHFMTHTGLLGSIGPLNLIDIDMDSSKTALKQAVRNAIPINKPGNPYAMITDVALGQNATYQATIFGPILQVIMPRIHPEGRSLKGAEKDYYDILHDNFDSLPKGNGKYAISQDDLKTSSKVLLKTRSPKDMFEQLADSIINLPITLQHWGTINPLELKDFDTTLNDPAQRRYEMPGAISWSNAFTNNLGAYILINKGCVKQKPNNPQQCKTQLIKPEVISKAFEIAYSGKDLFTTEPNVAYTYAGLTPIDIPIGVDTPVYINGQQVNQTVTLFGKVGAGHSLTLMGIAENEEVVVSIQNANKETGLSGKTPLNMNLITKGVICAKAAKYY